MYQRAVISPRAGCVFVAKLRETERLAFERVDKRRGRTYVPVMAVDYLVRRPGGSYKAVAGVRQRPTEERADARFAVQHTFDQGGVFEIKARMMLATKLDSSGLPLATEVLESGPIRVTIDEVISSEYLEYATDSERNLICHAEPKASASSAANTASWCGG